MSTEASKNNIHAQLSSLKNSFDDTLAAIAQAQKETHAEL